MNPFKKNNNWLLCQPELTDDIEAAWFEQSHWLNQGRLLGANSGRGSAWIIKSEHGKWVLRHYFRGGLYAKVSRDKYLWTGVNNCRAFKEFQLLSKLQTWQLPAPNPVAARVNHHGLFYRNDLIMAQIMHQQTFGQYITKKEQDLTTWHLVGKTIALFHNKGVFHSDLNANNVLLNEDQVHLIDFDKGQIKTPNTHWQLKNIQRLKRSVEKISQQSCQKELKPYWDALTTSWQQHLT